MTFKDAYTESFAERGSRYDQAMKQVPESRREEFLAVVEELPATGGGIVLDVPAGGGYLQRYLPARFQYQSYEPVGAFKGQSQVDPERTLIPFPRETGTVDVLVSVAGIHHFQNNESLFKEMARVVKPDGQLVLADVHQHSSVSTFLDGYIDTNNSTGHHGYYLGDQTLLDLENCGWHVLSAKRKHYHWVFETMQQMAEYCHLLFDIRHNDFAQTSEAIAEQLGVDPHKNGVGMRWELFVIKAEKRSMR